MDACSQCKNRTTKSHMITCEKCAACVHLECLKAGRPSPIEGDIFFQFTCSKCSPSDEEQLKHMKLPWITVVHLALYNLQLEGKSKCGFFKWKEHVCAYIDRHWHNFFDCARKKSVTWHGTVAGTLSNGSPQFFTSGSTLLKQPGWWKLSVCKPPTLQSVLQFKSASTKSKTGKQTYKEPVHSVVEEPRSRPKISPIEAAIQRKAKRDSIDGTKDSKKQKLGSDSSSSHTESQVNLRATTDQQVEVTCDRDPLTDKKQHLYSESVSALLGTVDSDSDIEIDPCSLSPLQTASQHTEHVENVVTNPLGHHENNPGDSWDQIMANFCAGTVPDVGSTVVIKQEPEDLVPEVAETVIIKPEPWSADCADEVSKNRQFTQNSWQESALIKNESASHPQPEHASYSSIEDFRVTTSTSEIEAHLTTSCDTSQYQSEAETISETDETSSYSTEVSDNVRLQTRKRRRKSVQTEPITAQNKQRYALMSMYEEKQLLKSLLTLESAVHSNKKACRLKRKLQLREIKRERGLPTFDLDAMMNRLVEQKSQLYGLQFTQAQENFTKMKPTLPQSSVNPLDVRILDRFQEAPTSSISVIETDKQTNVHESNTSLAETHQPVRVQSSGVSFLNKLVGTEDDQLQSIHSPYTSRVLKPFIRRDYETVPLKMKLLSEIQAYAYRDDPDWKPPSRPPIDYCYVRPQHIPTVNSYCKEFFWPGIDMSECLQYPDFSCIVMYRKFVIGFAFMVPDVKHNEAYISFIFTHPEWRGAGIAKFMVYHLIQTCMGKDVTLHVSANNPAMLLYQKFGFKPEEFILDFYDKYFPLDSKESRHAFFLRLRR